MMHDRRPMLSRGLWVLALIALSMHLGLSADVRAADGVDAAGVTFAAPGTVIGVDRPAVVAFGIQPSAAADRTFDAAVSDDNVLHMVTAPTVLAGHDTGYLVVQGRTAGEATLTVGEARIAIKVEPALAAASESLRIITPMTGCFAWGEIAVGVELPRAHGGADASVTLRIDDDGPWIEPADELRIDRGPMRRLVFALDCAALDPGPRQLRAVATYADGSTAQSEAVTVHIVHPDDAVLLAGECEDRLDDPRPERYGGDAPKVGSDAGASGGRFVTNYGAQPAWCLNESIETGGWYQLIMRARGDLAGGALPTLGLRVDEDYDARTAARLATVDWHRLPVGVPVWIDAGEHVFVPFFENDFWVDGLADRNLYLDRYELARVQGPRHGDMPARLTARTRADDLLRVAFTRPIDGRVVAGTVRITGNTWWHDAERTAPPMVELLVNGEVISTQTSAEPLFWIAPRDLRAGANTIALRATLASGASAVTPTQTVTLAHDPGDAQAGAFHRFTMLDSRWDEPTHDLLTDRDRAKGHKQVVMHTNATATLTLPDELAGRYALHLEARAEEFEGPPTVEVRLLAGDKVLWSRTYDVHGWWRTHELGVLDLPAGPKRLEVAYTNDHHEQDKGDRNLWLRSVVLHGAPDGADREPPRVALRYPADGQTVHVVDCVVAEGFDDRAIAWADLVIDGQAQRLHISAEAGVGRLVFPLLLDELAVGEHRINVRVQDHAGNAGESQPVTIHVSDTPPSRLGPYARAVRLLNRFGFGPEPAELAAVLIEGEAAYLHSRLTRSFDSPGDLAALGYATTIYPREGDQYAVQHRAIQQLQLTDNPVRMRFVLWAQNHFSTYLRKTEGDAKQREHLRFCELGAARFDELLRASAASAAMLRYLDQASSYAGQINENYAREIMELHTLGVHGGYTQMDVTALAHLLAGWMSTREAALDGIGNVMAEHHRYEPALSDGQPRQVLGMRFAEAPPAERHTRVELALTMLASHPATASFVSRKLIEHYVEAPADDAMTRDIAAVFMTTGGDMTQVLLAIAAHERFHDPALPGRLASPMDYTTRISRTTEQEMAWAAGVCMTDGGMGMFDRASPDGYPQDDAAWADSNALLQRWRFAQRARWSLYRLVPGPWIGQTANQPQRWLPRVADAAAVRLTGAPLSDESHEAVRAFYDATQGEAWARMTELVVFIGQLPEANMR